MIWASKVSVYHLAMVIFHAPSNPSGPGGMYREIIRSTPFWPRGSIPGPRRDYIFVNTGDMDIIGMKGLLIAQVHLFQIFVWQHWLSEHKNSLYLKPLNICSSFFNFPLVSRSFATLHPYSPQFPYLPTLQRPLRNITLTYLNSFAHESHQSKSEVKIHCEISLMYARILTQQGKHKPQNNKATTRQQGTTGRQSTDKGSSGRSMKGPHHRDLHRDHYRDPPMNPRAGSLLPDCQQDDPLPQRLAPARIASSSEGLCQADATFLVAEGTTDYSDNRCTLYPTPGMWTDADN